MSTQPPAWQPPASVPSLATKRPVRTWDVVVTIVLLVLLGVLAAIVSFFGFFLAMASDPCGARQCNTDLIATGMMTAVILPWVVLLIAAIGAIVLLVRRRLAFWVPLVASPFVVGSWFLGAVIASSGVPAS